MKKIFNLYIIMWMVLLAIFNVISFLSLNLAWIESNTTSFWIAYVIISIIFIGQFVCSYVTFKVDSAKKLFYNISLIKVSYICLIISFIIGLICMLISFIPYWVSLIVCITILATNIYAVVKATVVIDEIERIDEKVITNTLFIKNLTIDAQTLLSSTTSDTTKKECKKVYEAIRYSDPISHEELSTIENQIKEKFEELTKAVNSNEDDKIVEITNEIIVLINNRNSKCKLIK